jgi:hypothetical protein
MSLTRPIASSTVLAAIHCVATGHIQAKAKCEAALHKKSNFLRFQKNLPTFFVHE